MSCSTTFLRALACRRSLLRSTRPGDGHADSRRKDGPNYCHGDQGTVLARFLQLLQDNRPIHGSTEELPLREAQRMETKKEYQADVLETGRPQVQAEL